MRPLRAVQSQGVELSVIPCSPTGELDVQDVRSAITSRSRAIILTHASNVTGTIMPLAEIGALACEHDCVFCVDAAQTAGAVPIDVSDMQIDILIFSGHKSLYGPQGTGGLYIGRGLEDQITPLMRGGTGSRSEFEHQPDFLPDKYESGTLNAMGVAGLGAGVRYVLTEGVQNIREKEIALTLALIDGLKDNAGIRLYGCLDPLRQTPVVSLSFDKLSPSEAAFTLDENYKILSRPGLHCAPAAHRTIGTFSEGTLRFSPGYFNTEDEILYTLDAVAQLASG